MAKEKLPAQNVLNEELQVEINKHKVNINRSIFKKDMFERKTIKMLKKEWKNSPQARLTTIRSK